MTGTPSRTARVPIVRWDLKEAEGKILTRGTRIACEASCRGARTRRCPKPSVIRNGPVYMRRVWQEGYASYPGRSACLPRAKALFMTVWRPSTRSAEHSCGIRQG